jgi:hypothetical protein
VTVSTENILCGGGWRLWLRVLPLAAARRRRFDAAARRWRGAHY